MLKLNHCRLKIKMQLRSQKPYKQIEKSHSVLLDKMKMNPIVKVHLSLIIIITIKKIKMKNQGIMEQ